MAALLQVAKVSAAKSAVLLDVAKVSATTPAQTATLVLQVASVAATSTNPTTAPTLTVTVSPTGTVYSGTTVTLTANPGGQWNSVAWSQTNGAPVTLSGADPLVKSFVAPAIASGSLLSFAAVASGNAGDTTVIVSVPVGPHLQWYLTSSGWQPSYLEIDTAGPGVNFT